MPKTITEEEYHEHRESYDGFCTVCQDFTRCGDTEPDARDYPCPDCEGLTCIGTEEALIAGEIEF